MDSKRLQAAENWAASKPTERERKLEQLHLPIMWGLYRWVQLPRDVQRALIKGV